jgi:hypothetical protein
MSTKGTNDLYNKRRRERYRNDVEYRSQRKAESNDRYNNPSKYPKRMRTKTEHSATWVSWKCMRARVMYPGSSKYAKYHNFTIDPRWDKYENFHEDMGDRPEGMTLDRKDNNGGYCKENCHWATPKQQARNKRTNKLSMDDVREMKELFGKIPRRELAEKYGVSPCTISNIKHGRVWVEEVANV